MPKPQKPRFVATLPLRTTPRDEAILRKRFKAAQSFYNAMLGECLRRSRLMRESRAWRKARNMPASKERSAAFREQAKRFGFRERDLYAEHPIGGTCIKRQRRSWIGDHLDSHSCQSLASRAFNAVEKAMFRHGHARFRRLADMRSIEGRSDDSPLHWTGTGIAWFGLSMEAVINREDPVIAHALNHRVKLARVVRMTIRGRERYFAQIVCEGRPLRKERHRPAEGVVGLDIGPSTIAVVGEKTASLRMFCVELDDTHREIRRLQRRADRQVRSTNPHCFDSAGRWVRGQRMTVRSRGLRRTRNQIAELLRREREHRKNLHGRLAHEVLSHGDDVRTEKLSYRAFQRMFGRSVGHRAPGIFIARLKAEAAKWKASITEFDTRTTRLSQTCPNCGAMQKKLLSDRQHECPCGASGQRDQISAFLARFVAGNRLDAAAARTAWRAECNPLLAVSSVSNGPTDGASARVHRCRIGGRGPSREDAVCRPISGRDDVAGRKTQARARQNSAENGAHAHFANPKRSPSGVDGESELATAVPRRSRESSPQKRRRLDLRADS